MESVWRGVAVYLFLLILFRIAGKRSVAQITTFDFVLLLIIGEATQQALLGEDFSVTNAFLVIGTLLAMEIGFTLLKRRWPILDIWLDGVPMIIVENGVALKKRMHKARVDEEDVLAAARERHGLERMDQIKFAILERSGGISIVPAPAESSAPKAG
jgi:uncharacterized membrane protein YcaP (DUF421 family)